MDLLRDFGFVVFVCRLITEYTESGDFDILFLLSFDSVSLSDDDAANPPGDSGGGSGRDRNTDRNVGDESDDIFFVCLRRKTS